MTLIVKFKANPEMYMKATRYTITIGASNYNANEMVYEKIVSSSFVIVFISNEFGESNVNDILTRSC